MLGTLIRYAQVFTLRVTLAELRLTPPVALTTRRCTGPRLPGLASLNLAARPAARSPAVHVSPIARPANLEAFVTPPALQLEHLHRTSTRTGGLDFLAVTWHPTRRVACPVGRNSTGRGGAPTPPRPPFALPTPYQMKIAVGRTWQWTSLGPHQRHAAHTRQQAGYFSSPSRQSRGVLLAAGTGSFFTAPSTRISGRQIAIFTDGDLTIESGAIVDASGEKSGGGHIQLDVAGTLTVLGEIRYRVRIRLDCLNA